jgi:hypothetical protein
MCLRWVVYTGIYIRCMLLQSAGASRRVASSVRPPVCDSRESAMNAMMNCGSSMMWGMGLIGLLAFIALVLLIVALLKYLFSRSRS